MTAIEKGTPVEGLARGRCGEGIFSDDASYDGGMVIDFSPVSGVKVDAQSRVAKASPSVRLGACSVEKERQTASGPSPGLARPYPMFM